MKRRSPSPKAAAIGRARQHRIDERELGNRPGVANAFDFDDSSSATIEIPTDHNVSTCDTFGCPYCVAIGNRRAS